MPLTGLRIDVPVNGVCGVTGKEVAPAFAISASGVCVGAKYWSNVDGNRAASVGTVVAEGEPPVNAPDNCCPP